jgi:hypothetical protein
MKKFYIVYFIFVLRTVPNLAQKQQQVLPNSFYRWQQLIEQFRAENFRLYALSSQSVFSVALQSGLSALKTPQCYRAHADRNTECPGKKTANWLKKVAPRAHWAPLAPWAS